MIPVYCHFRGAPKTRIYYCPLARIIVPFAGIRRPVNRTENFLLSQTGLSKPAGTPTTRTFLLRLPSMGRLLSRPFKTQAPKPPKSPQARIRPLTAKISSQRHRHNLRLRHSRYQKHQSGWRGPFRSRLVSEAESFPLV